jgi:hypothetical protein
VNYIGEASLERIRVELGDEAIARKRVRLAAEARLRAGDAEARVRAEVARVRAADAEARLRADAEAPLRAEVARLEEKARVREAEWAAERSQLSNSAVSRCILCFERPINVAYVPCGHRCTCTECDDASTIVLCPNCRQHISTRVCTFDAGVLAD